MFSMVLVGSGSSHFFIRIRIQENDTDSTDPDPPHCLPMVKLLVCLQSSNFFLYFFVPTYVVYLPVWIRIRIRNKDTDPQRS